MPPAMSQHRSAFITSNIYFRFHKLNQNEELTSVFITEIANYRSVLSWDSTKQDCLVCRLKNEATQTRLLTEDGLN